MIEAVGVSEFIQGRPARFLEDLEEDLEVLRPEETKLISDSSSGYIHTLLFLDAHLRQTAPDDESIYLGHRAAMDALPYQLVPVYKALQMPRQRILIADAVGLGKTLEAGITIAELIRRGRGRRILVVTSKAMMVQFQKEFWSRFTIPLVKLDSSGIQRIRAKVPGNHNPFHYYDRAIVSVDTLKQDREYRSYLEQAYWDIIVIDEAQNVARRGKGQSASQRAKLASRLATRSDTLIMLSATPHDGRPESFASLMNMLDPAAIANESDYSKEDIRDLYVRRFKKDVLKDLRKHVPEREVQAIEESASPAEERVFETLNELQFKSIDSRRKSGQLFKTTLLKAMLSSPAACLETVTNRIKTLSNKESLGAEDRHDIGELERLKADLELISEEDFSKYRRLLALIRDDFGWKGRDRTDRIVIFTGRRKTLAFLKEHLAIDLKLKPEAIQELYGTMPDVDQNRIVEEFGQEKAKVRILIATEVASEGLNLHYLSHKLIHFDIPWSLMTLQQRNGRIDRYGQERQPLIRYMLTRSRLERMDEVERIIKVLLDKDDQAIKNIGDPSVFMGVFDAEAEEEITAEAIASGKSAGEFEQELDENASSGGEFDIFSWFEDADDESEELEFDEPVKGDMPSIFPSTFKFATTALLSLEPPPQNLNIREEEGLVELKLPVEMERRYKRLPNEIKPKPTELLQLTDRPSRVMQAMEAARREEKAWPAEQYLWELHPLTEWLTDRCLFRFGRHQAPTIELVSGLEEGEASFIVFGSFPNRRGRPVINRWVTVVFEDGKFARVEPLKETLERTQLGRMDIPNPGELNVDVLLPLRAAAIREAHHYLLAERTAFEQVLQPKFEEQQQRLDRLKGRHVEQLELRFQADKRTGALKQQKRQRDLNQIEKIFKDYRDWVDLSMTTETEPYIKLVAVLRHSNS